MQTVYLALLVGGTLMALLLAISGIGHGAGHSGHTHTGHIHLGHGGHAHGGHGGSASGAHGAGAHAHVGGAHAGQTHGGTSSTGGTQSHSGHGQTGTTNGGFGVVTFTLSWVSPISLAAFAMLFGAIGLVFGSSVLALPLAVAVGMLGAFAMRLLMQAFERSSTEPLALSADGAIGSVNATIYPGRTGEVIYTLEGLSRSLPARSPYPTALPRGTTVVITGRENGVALVEPLEPVPGMDEKGTAI